MEKIIKLLMVTTILVNATCSADGCDALIKSTVHTADAEDNTILHFVAGLTNEKLRTDWLTLLTSIGGDLLEENKQGKTPIDIAYKTNPKNTQKLVLTKLDSLIKSGSHGEYLENFIKKAQALKIDLNLPVGKQSATLLHGAAISGNQDAVDYLIKAKVKVNVVNDAKQTPLHYACLAQNSENLFKIVFSLTAGGADTKAKDNNGKTARDTLNWLEETGMTIKNIDAIKKLLPK